MSLAGGAPAHVRILYNLALVVAHEQRAVGTEVEVADGVWCGVCESGVRFK